MLISNFHKKHFILLSIILLIWTGCRENPQKEIIIPSEFQEYVDRFIAEGAVRGYEIDFSDTGLLIEFRDAVDTESGGVCFLGRHHIQIEKFYWDNANDLEKEGVIFHELGHCELDRLHRNDTLPNGEWLSRMRGDPIPQWASAVINYSGSRREYYIDELFDQTTPIPDWAYITADYEAYSPDDKEEKVFISEAEEFEKNLGLSTSLDFEIEFELDNGFSESWVGVQWGGFDHNTSIRIAFNGLGEFTIESGNEVFGIMRYYPKLTSLKPDFNKITIRKISDKYYIFLNEKFLYWFDFVPPSSSRVSSLVAGATNPMYRNVRISQLK